VLALTPELSGFTTAARPDAGFASCYEQRVMPVLRSSCRQAAFECAALAKAMVRAGLILDVSGFTTAARPDAGFASCYEKARHAQTP
jgi:hypothetical protein